MIDVLIVAYHYPPIVSGGTERATSLVRHLPALGYRPHILTTNAFGDEGHGSVYRAGEWVGWYRRLFNPAAEDLPADTRSRTRTGSSLTPLARMARSFLVPDGQVGWLPSAYRSARHILVSHPVRLVLTTGPPFSSHLLGLALHQTTQLPWIADFRDAWTYDPLDSALKTSGLRNRIESCMERVVIERAARIACVTEVAAEHLRSRSSEANVTVIPNGYAVEDVPDRMSDPDGSRFRFVHTGSFSSSHPLRSPEPLVEAARLLRSEADFELVFVGHLTEDEKKILQPLVESGHATIAGTVNRAEALVWQARADVLLVVDHPRQVMASNIPGKVYEYGASGKPILAVASPGATRQLVEDSGSGLCVGHDPADIASAMRAFIDGDADVKANPVWWEQFERKNAVRSMAELFGEVMER